jgi:uncharacterized membrane protein
MLQGTPKSTATIKGHPIHPMLVISPIAFWVGALIADIVFWSAQDLGWAEGSTWLISAGLVGAVLAAGAGLIDFLGDRRIRALPEARQHLVGNVAAVLLQTINLVIRLAAGAAAILPLGLILSLITVAILVFTGWKGGELVYRHGVGVGRGPRMNGRMARFDERPPAPPM